VNNIVITTDGSTMTVNPAPPTPSPPMLAPRVYTFGIGKRTCFFAVANVSMCVAVVSAQRTGICSGACPPVAMLQAPTATTTS
jgi:hypothetical protein